MLVLKKLILLKELILAVLNLVLDSEQEYARRKELNEQQKKRRAQVQFEAQHYTDEDWDLIRAKIKANAKLSKKERARAKRNKPMTQSQLKTYMMNYLKNQGTWKLSQLKNLSFEEVKEEFDKLVKQVESFAPINFEATKASLKRFGEELQTKTPKRLKSDEVKDVEPTKKSGKRRKQMARKGLHTDLDKDDSEGSNEVSEQDNSVIESTLFELRVSGYIYVVERKYPLSAEICKTMLDKKLQGGKPDEDCYKMLKMMEKQAEHQSDTQVITVKMEILLEPTSNKLMVEHAEFDESNTYVLERFYTLAGNPVKEILLKLNLPDHRSILTDSKILKDGGEDAILKLFKITYQERYEHVGLKVTSFTRWQSLKDGESRLCSVDDLKVFKITFSHSSQDKGTSSSLKSMITTSNHKLMIEIKDYKLETKDEA
ncbi:hypothetical protein Tco_0212227 [Tanacetum coccineum]